jgi:hypothetical protein
MKTGNYMLSQVNESFLSSISLPTERLIHMGIDPKWAHLNDKLGFEMFIVVWRSLKSNTIQEVILVPNYQYFKQGLLCSFIEQSQQDGLTDEEIAIEVTRIFGSK